MDREALARAIDEVAHLRGRFRLRSGQMSDEYFDKYQFESRPQLLRAIAEHLVGLLPATVDVLGGLELGGIPLAVALSLQTGIPAVFVRKKAKPYGTQKIAEGVAVQGRSVVLVEDVVTTGGQVLESAAALRAAGAQVEVVLCVIDRGEQAAQHLAEAGLQLRALFTAKELRRYAGKQVE